MQKIALVLVSLFTLFGCKTPGMPGRPDLSFHDTSKLACDLAEVADIKITYFPSADKFDIGVGENNNGIHDVVSFSLKELEDYFNKQQHKGLIVIVFEKTKLSEPEIYSKACDLTTFFFSAGYRRVVIEQAYGNGRGIWSDKTNPQPSAPPNPHSPSAQGAGGR